MTRMLRTCILIALILPLAVASVRASDHADPIDLFNRLQQEGAITDLFVFPELDPTTGQPILDERGRPRNLVVVLCVRRALTWPSAVTLEPYTYTLNMDLNRAVTIGGPEDQNTLRYGGTVVRPEEIRPDVTITMRLGRPMVDGQVALREPLGVSGLKVGREQIRFWSGIRDDPFIFPPFFEKNVVAMVMSIPMNAFPDNQQDFVVWATSSRNGKQIDHVGRSLRTQNPRFEILNTLEPKDHVAAIKYAEEHPTLMRDLFLRLGLQQTFAYRKSWDEVPDVMIYSLRRPVGFPNGRKLTDDVAKLLAEYGDTLLYEISYIGPAWPRRTTNDKAFLPQFPYLADPWLDKPPVTPVTLTTASRLKLLSIAAGILVLWLLTAALLAFWIDRRRQRLRYL